MSWDIFVQDLPADARTIRDIPEHFTPSPLCKRAELIQLIKRAVPSADFTDPTWGQFETPSFSVEFNLGEHELVQSFALHVCLSLGASPRPAYVAGVSTVIESSDRVNCSGDR